MINKAIEAASQAPLNDAAYILWSRRFEFDRCEGYPKPLVKYKDYLQLLAEGSTATDNARYGSTFPRLKAAHPKSADEELRSAIRLAVKLDQESLKKFSYSEGRSLQDNVHIAVELARKDNPDLSFLDSTYSLLEYNMRTALR